MFRFRPVVSQVSKKVFQAPACQFATYKSSTGLVGLAVDPNGRETLLSISEQILGSVKRIPESSDYRVQVEKWFNYINKVATEKHDIRAIEDEIELGQIEEVIEMAKDELDLVNYYYENKGWELVAQAKAEADAIVQDMADSIYFSSPEARASYKKPEAAPATPPKA